MIDTSPPYFIDINLERAVLGGLIHRPDMFHSVDSILPAGKDTFYDNDHKTIYSVISRLVQAKEPFDIVLLYNEIYKTNSNITRSQVINLLEDCYTSAICDRYAIRLADMYQRRQVLMCCESAVLKISSGNDLAEVAKLLKNELFNITSANSQKGASSLCDIATDWWNECLEKENVIENRIYTGFRDLDNQIALLPGTHFILGARTSMGKTSFAIQTATNIARMSKRPLIFSMEQSKESIAACYVSQISGIDRFAAMTNKLNQQQKSKVMEAAHIWGSNDINSIGIFDKPYSAQEIRQKIIMEKAHSAVDIVIIDFLHNMRPPKGMKREGHEWLRETAAELEEIAIELKVPIITLAQLSRKVETRSDKRPVMSDIREAGEDNADIVAFLYRDDYYHPQTTEEPGLAEIIIAKNRHGQTGTIKLEFISYSTEFKDLP